MCLNHVSFDLLPCIVFPLSSAYYRSWVVRTMSHCIQLWLLPYELKAVFNFGHTSIHQLFYSFTKGLLFSSIHNEIVQHKHDNSKIDISDKKADIQLITNFENVYSNLLVKHRTKLVLPNNDGSHKTTYFPQQ